MIVNPETKLKKHNFSAGPCILPESVLTQASNAVKELNNSGLSLIEISHRSKDFIEIMETARNLVRELLNVPESHEVLFLQGGASLGFYISAMNFMKAESGSSGYLVTGEWAKKAHKEANLVGDAQIIGSSEDKNFSYIPSNFQISSNLDYVHFTSNNTIFGTQMHHFPISRIPVISDMSSDIFSRKVEVKDFAMIYAGAQKNMGPAGTTLYIVNKNLLGKTGRKIPSMLNLETHISKDSMFNTPPVFPVYVSMLTLQWLKNLGGIPAITEMNQKKADCIYGEIDRNPLFKGAALNRDRSIMNATFVLNDESHKEAFDAMWNEAGISGIKGHRSVGGYRASMYNALPLESVELLVSIMKELENKVG